MKDKLLSKINFFLSFFFNISIIRFNQHYNGIILFKNDIKGIYIKRSFLRSGNKLIDNEIKGYRWYLKRIRKMNYLNYIKNPIFSKLIIKQFYGVKAPYKKNIIKNTNFFISALKHYKKIWDNSKMVPAHGDFTFDNLIFDKKKRTTRIIDWENFKENREVWGFDISYLLLSLIILPNIRKKKIPDLEKKKFVELWKITKKNITCKDLRKNPMIFFEKKFKHDIYWKRLSNKYPRKYFLTRINSSIREEIIKIF